MEESIYNKVKKLLAFGEGRVANENEMNVALGAALRILAKHNLTLDDFRKYDSQEASVDVEELRCGNKKLANWKGQLAMWVARANFCYVYRGGPTIYIVGKRENRESAIAMLEYLFFMVDAHTDAAFKRYTGKEHGKTFNNNYRLGIVTALCSRIAEEMDTINSEMGDSNALVKVDMYEDNQALLQKWLADGGVQLRKDVVYKISGCSEAMALGLNDGQGISLRPCEALPV